MSGSRPQTKSGKKGPVHPFAGKEPKPTRARLMSLLDPLGRKRYAEVERFLATVNGATSGLHYYEDNGWGWAVRYMLGAKDVLCTLHLLPHCFEATVAVPAGGGPELSGPDASPELRRRVARARPKGGVRWVRLPVRSDVDYHNFQALIRLKSTALRAKDAKA